MPLQSSIAQPALTLEQQLGQKLLLDFRYFCHQGASQTVPNANDSITR